MAPDQKLCLPTKVAGPIRPTQPILSGALVRLEPLTLDHVADLEEAAIIDRSAYGFTTVPEPGEMAPYVEAKLEKAGRDWFFPFAQIRVGDSKAVGCTALGHFQVWPEVPGISTVEIGWTWLAASAQRTGLNHEAKFLLLAHAFESIGVARVEIKTDARNVRSRAAIVRLGATFEGVLRQVGPSGAPNEMGRLRDTAMHSIVRGEWPAIKASLEERLLE